ncbi:MAG: cell division ATP-binding protein FtsE, partial [Gammaproteobacteria bacterium RBG_16_57_12]
MIHFSNVSKHYPGGQDALLNIDLHIDRGEMVFLTGPSGAGKSTLLKLITLIERCTRGQIIINDQHLDRVSRRRIPYFRRNLGIIFQDYKLLDDQTIFDNVALPLVVAGYPHQEIGRRVRAALDKVGLLHRERHKPITLSGGEQQRVGIARAIVHRPPILIADEPTGNLDPELSQDIMSLFRELNQVGITVLIASHDLELINRIGCRVITLH